MSEFPLHWRRIGAFIGVAFLVLIVIEFNARLEELNRLSQEAQAYRAKATQAAQTQAALQTQVAYAASDEAVEKYAREGNRMIQEGDIPVVPFGTGDNGTVVSTPTPAPTSTPPPNWEVWWDLFFGKR